MRLTAGADEYRAAGPSLLELLHPDGRCLRTVLTGSGCPARLQPADSSPNGELDLVVVAPNSHELQDPRWLETAVPAMAAVLSPDGLLCALTPPQHRSRLVRLLEAEGLDTGCVFLYHGTPSGEDRLLPLQREARRYLAGTMVRGYTRMHHLTVWLLSRLRLASVLRRWHRGALIVARHPGARPLFEWLLHAAPEKASASTAVVDAKWRRGRGSVVVRILNIEGKLDGIAKLTLGEVDAGCRISQEADFLKRAVADLRHVGFSTPEARILPSAIGVPVLLENVVPGESAAALLLRRRLSPSELLATLGERLLNWSRRTRVSQTVDSIWLEREILRAAALIVPQLDGGGPYLSWLQTRCHALIGRRIPLVTTHGDLTMWNLLVTSVGSLGLVDWEGGRAEGLPLSDFCYAALDIDSAAHRYQNRVEAFVRCFEGVGPEAQQIAGLRTGLAQALGLSRGAALLCFHACWLQHAADEATKRTPMEPRPFRDIVARLASRPEAFQTVGLEE